MTQTTRRETTAASSYATSRVKRRFSRQTTGIRRSVFYGHVRWMLIYRGKRMFNLDNGTDQSDRPHACFWGIVILVALSGCPQQSDLSSTDRSQSFAPETTQPLPLDPKRLADDLPGLHNVIEVSDGIFSGSEPKGDEAFASLGRLGIKTVVSVDGARPSVNAARQTGLRYVHIPFGYDGISGPAGAGLARVAREAERPIYVHCHHGRHRGPAATAIICIAAGRTRATGAIKILETAGTSREYPGLWRDVEAWQSPPADARLPELVEVADVKSLAATMASVDRHCDNLKLCRDANWQPPQNHPDLVPAQEALLLREALHEANRTTPGDQFGETFAAWLKEAEDLAGEIEADLKESNVEAAGMQLQRLEQLCKQCHANHRN